MFDVDGLLSDLVACLADADPRRAAKDVVTRAMATRSEVAAALTPSAGGLSLLYESPELTVINIAWAPRMRIIPHEHRMWALIGIYAGVEDNQFYRRGADGELVETTGRRLDEGDVALLGAEAIHAVANPADRLAGAVHVYGGDFVNQPRSQWGPGDLVERPFDLAELNRQFLDANLAAGLTASP
jgi:predicted metal-dependent enzyme (double-stranded beta helix superfamily)